MKIAVVGTGIAGNVAAWHLARAGHELTVYEADHRVGGHTHTHTVRQGRRDYRIDTGFIVFNDRTYPQFISLLGALGVQSQPSSMSFSVRDERSGLEYNGTTLNSLFAQRSNLFRPSFLGMIRDILRFNRSAPALLAASDHDLTLADYLARERYGRAFIEQYIVPMGAAIWSTDPQSMRGFPAHFFVRFLHNHGMLTIDDRPVWRVVRGGSSSYLDRLTAPFRDRIRCNTPVRTVRRVAGGAFVQAGDLPPERFDAVFIACHSDQALAMLADPTAEEARILGAIRFQENTAVLHTDARLMPRRRLAHAAWNYHIPAQATERVALTYNMNILQGLDSDEPFLVTLNRDDAVRPDRILARMTYHHPLFAPDAVRAQAQQHLINGERSTWYCGAWWRNGFHEDGVVSALTALEDFHRRTGHAERPLLRSA